MNILIDLVPKQVEIEGKLYDINTCFRTMILFEELMSDEQFTKEEKGYMALGLFYSEIPENIPEAINRVKYIYSGKEEDNESIEEEGKDSEQENSKPKENPPIFSFKHDADYIYSAYLDQYGIDLQDIEYLHWWKFKALFKGLKEDNKINQIMGFRSKKITNDMSREEKKYYRKMKKLYAIPDNRSEKEKEEDFHETMSSII